MERSGIIDRKTKETQISVKLDLDGSGQPNISTGIPFFDHMLTLFTVHGFFDLFVKASGDLEIDSHHTIEDTGLVLGDALQKALGERKGIKRYGSSVTPMDEALARVSIDLSNRPFLVYRVPPVQGGGGDLDIQLASEFFRAFATRGGITLHINVDYGENEHHILESIFKATGRALDQAARFDDRITDVISTKGIL